MLGMKITALEESADFTILDTEKLFSKLKSHELSCKGCPNHDAPFSNKALIIGARIGGHVVNPTNTTDSSALEFALPSLTAAFDEQYESILTMRLPCWRESFVPYTGSARRGGYHHGAASSVATPSISLPTAPSKRRLTPSISTTTLTGLTPATRARTRRSTASGTRRRRRRSSRR
jgi:hypothetical protein